MERFKDWFASVAVIVVSLLLALLVIVGLVLSGSVLREVFNIVEPKSQVTAPQLAIELLIEDALNEQAYQYERVIDAMIDKCKIDPRSI